MITLKPPSNLRKSQSTVDCGKSTGNLNRTECLNCLVTLVTHPDKKTTHSGATSNSLNPEKQMSF